MALPKVSLLLVAGSLLAAAAPSVASAQNITIDGRFSAAQTLTGPYYSIGANLGKQVGSNLFHSFGQFSLVKGDTAAFTSTGSTSPINNVIGRVTGGIRSDIDGAIKSKITGANLFLINPSGIVFGPNATVNVLGAFHASTADYIKMADGAKFQATQPDGSTLSAAPPAAFGFLTANPAKISVNGSTLGVPPGQTLGLVGGPVSIAAASPTATTGARLAAPAGTIHVTSAAGTGEVPVDPRNTSAVTVSNFGPVKIKGGSKLDVSDPKNLGSGGSVFIRSGALTIDASEINADNYGAGPGEQLMLQADSTITLSDKAKIHALARAEGTGSDVILQTSPGGAISLDNSTVKVGSNATGDGGALSVKAGQLTLTNGAALKTKAEGSGNGGPIAVTADAVLLDGGAALDASTGIFSTTSGAGSGGSISIVAGELALHNGANALAQTSGTGAGGGLDVRVSGLLTVDSGSALKSDAEATGGGGPIKITADTVLLDGRAALDKSSLSTGIFSTTSGSGNGGSITIVAGQLALHNGASVLALSSGSGAGGPINVTVNDLLTVESGGAVKSEADGSGKGGPITITADTVVFDGGVALDDASLSTGIFSITSGTDPGSGSGGSVTIVAGQLTLHNGAGVLAQSSGVSAGGSVDVRLGGSLTVDSGASLGTTASGDGNAGDVSVMVSGPVTIDMSVGAGPSILDGIGSLTNSRGNAGNVIVNAGSLSIAQLGGIFSQVSTETSGKESSGTAGTITVSAGSLSIRDNGFISSVTFGPGDAGDISVRVAGALTIDGTMADRLVAATGIVADADPRSRGNAGAVTVDAGSLSIVNSGEISATSFGPGKGGDLTISARGGLTIDGTMTPDSFTGLGSPADPGSTGNAGNIIVSAGSVAFLNNGSISVLTSGPGSGGGLMVNTGALTISNNGSIVGTTFGSGKGGRVSVSVAGPLLIDGTSANTQFLTGISAQTQGSGNAGIVSVDAGIVSVLNGGAIAASTGGSGAGGDVTVNVASTIALSGPRTGIVASATPSASGDAGSVTVGANALTVAGGAQIASTTAGTGKGGDVKVIVANEAALSGSGSGVTAAAGPRSAGTAGEVTLTAGGAIRLSGGAQVSSSTAGAGNGGSVQVTDHGSLTLADVGTGIVASSTAGGNAGSVAVSALQISIASGAEISSTTAGTGAGGAVNVTATGPVMLDGAGTQIAASATGPQSGAGGEVTVQANTLTVEDGAQIASTTAGPGNGGPVTVNVASDIVLPDPGPQITAQSSGSGDAGSITVSSTRLLMNNGAAISTQATTANGGNITLNVGDLVYLLSSKITASVNTKTGSGGNITIDPQLVVLNHSSITATAAEGRGGNIRINAGAFIQSADSSVDASSEKGISGTVVITGPRVDVNGALVVLSGELRGHAAVLREACAARSDRPVSSLVEAGRGGLPQDPETTLPALYIADRDLSPNLAAGAKTEVKSAPLQTTVRLTMHCG